MDITCAVCEGVFPISDQNRALAHEGTTLDCLLCGALLVFVDSNGETKSFHIWMHERNPTWPVDGTNTGFLEL